jgi:hypothetical protein
MTYRNPWLQPYTVSGYDQFGQPSRETVTVTPPLYFWLGLDAEPKFRFIEKIEVGNRRSFEGRVA